MKEEDIHSPQKWLVKTCSRLALDVLKSARVKRTKYICPWLPEPLLEDSAIPHREEAPHEDCISIALMMALEKLSPAQRASFILHDVFQYTFAEVADILEKDSATCRQLASRARAALAKDRPRYTVSEQEHRQLLYAFLQAAQTGEIETLQSLLTESVSLHSDGGGKVSAARKVLCGSELVSRFFINISKMQSSSDKLEVIERHYNGAPGMVIYEDNQPVLAMTIDIDPETKRISQIYNLRNPEKLKAFHLTDNPT